MLMMIFAYFSRWRACYDKRARFCHFSRYMMRYVFTKMKIDMPLPFCHFLFVFLPCFYFIYDMPKIFFMLICCLKIFFLLLLLFTICRDARAAYARAAADAFAFAPAMLLLDAALDADTYASASMPPFSCAPDAFMTCHAGDDIADTLRAMPPALMRARAAPWRRCAAAIFTLHDDARARAR